ncbi:MAG: S41 family peptidase [Alphaproteobacteria bacterium]
MREFTLDGLRGLKAIEPEFEITSDGSRLDVIVGPTLATSLKMPLRDNPDRWADVTVAVIEAGRAYSDRLNKASAERLFEAVYDAAIAALDTFSRYDTASQAPETRAVREGFVGIGISVRMQSDFALVVLVHENTPSARGGLKAKDRITHVDGDPVEGWSQQQLVQALRGQANTRVHLTIDRPGDPQAIEVDLTRAWYVPQTVRVDRRGRVAVVRISSFNQDTGRTLARSIAKLRRHRAELDGIVLDLRDNPGGLLDQAVEVADAFLADGEIVATQGRHPHSMQRFSASGADLASGLPVVVLVNGNSASASEVVAAALQDRGRAVVIGTNSYGKGTVQTVYRLPNDGELTLTWSRLYAPSGYRLQDLGVLPTVCSHTGSSLGATDLIATIRDSKAPTRQKLREWRTVDGADDTALAALRDVCPAGTDNGDTDMEIAEALMGDPSAYADAVEVADPIVAHR